MLSTPEQLLAHLPKPLTESPDFKLSPVVERLMNLEGLSEELFPVHQKRLVTQLIDKLRCMPTGSTLISVWMV